MFESNLNTNGLGMFESHLYTNGLCMFESNLNTNGLGMFESNLYTNCLVMFESNLYTNCLGMFESCIPEEEDLLEDETIIPLPPAQPFQSTLHRMQRQESSSDSPPAYSSLENSHSPPISPLPPAYSDIIHKPLDLHQIYAARETDVI